MGNSSSVSIGQGVFVSVLPSDDRALRAVAVQFFVNGVVVASYVPRLPEIRDEIGVSLATIGLILAVASSAGVIGSVVVGTIVERLGTKRAMVGGAACLVAFLPFVSFSTTPILLVLVLAAISASDVVTDVAMNIQGSRLSARRATPVMNRLHAAWSIGTVVGGGASAALAEAGVPLRTHLLVAAALLAMTLAYVAPGLLPTDHDDDHTEASSTTPVARSLIVTFFVFGAAAIVPELISSDWAAFRLTDDLDASPGVAGAAYVSFTIGMVTGRLFGDHVAKAVGNESMLRLSGVVATAGIAFGTFAPVVAVAFVGFCVAGIGVSVMFPHLYDAAARAPRPGPCLGALTAGSRVALLGAPLLVGLLADTSLSVGAAMALVTIPATIWLATARPKTEAAAVVD